MVVGSWRVRIGEPSRVPGYQRAYRLMGITLFIPFGDVRCHIGLNVTDGSAVGYTSNG